MGTLPRLATLVLRALMPSTEVLYIERSPGAAGMPSGPREWADVVARYADVVYTMAFRLTGDDEEARDLAQDVLVRLHRGLGRYEEGNFEGWLYRTTLNAFRDRVRKRKRLREDELPNDATAEMGLAPGVEETAQQHELAGEVQRALVRLPPEFREAVVLRDLQGRSYEEIAAVLGV